LSGNTTNFIYLERCLGAFRMDFPLRIDAQDLAGIVADGFRMVTLRFSPPNSRADGFSISEAMTSVER
jgi:hypothetical protein